MPRRDSQPGDADPEFRKEVAGFRKNLAVIDAFRDQSWRAIPEGPGDIAIANIDLLKKSLGTMAKSVENLTGFVAKLAGLAAATAR